MENRASTAQTRRWSRVDSSANGGSSVGQPRVPWALVFATLVFLGACSEKGQRIGGGHYPPIPDERAARGYAGPVRRVVTSRLSLDGSGKPTLYGSSVIVFDTAGRAGTEEFFDAQGKLTERTMVLRDRSGRPEGQESRTASGLISVRSRYDWDEGGHLVGERWFSADGQSLGAALLEYDGAGRLIQRLSRSTREDGSASDLKVLYRYDQGGQLLDETYADTSGTVLRIEHIYRDGRRVRSADYQRGLWLEYLTFYDYDQYGNVVGERSYQIPENEYGASFASVTTEGSLPTSFLASETRREFKYDEP